MGLAPSSMLSTPEYANMVSLALDRDLCGKCAEFERTALCSSSDILHRGFDHYRYFGQICAAAHLGCRFCRLLEEGILHTHFAHPRSEFNPSRDVNITSQADVRRMLLQHDTTIHGLSEYDRVRYRLLPMARQVLTKSLSGMHSNDSSIFCFGFQRFLGLYGKVEMETYFMLSVLEDDQALRDGNFCGREVSPDFDAALARDWLASCMSSHSCHTLVQPSPESGPSRLVEVRPAAEGLGARLVDCSGTTVPAYAALSYCWPKGRAHLTVAKNLQAYAASIPLHSLPVTILDAVKITNALGLQYLWVDSLCIVQDSQREWEIECTKMASIYANAIVTLAASGNTGMLRDSAFYPIQDACTLKYCDSEGVAVGQVKVRFAGWRFAEDVEFAGKHTDPAASWKEWRPPLETRGWALQERLLSSRVLLFDREKSHKMRWQCAAGRRIEYVHGLLDHDLNSSALEHAMALALNQPQVQGSENSYKLWQRVLDDFWQRDLTFPMDLLPALSGIARVVQQRTHDTYLAGLWQNDLPRCLIWKVAGLKDSQQSNLAVQSAPYRGPSWSWARSDIPGVFLRFLGWMEGRTTSYMEFVSACTRVEGQDSFGRVTPDCLLTIQAPSRTVKIRTVRTRDRSEAEQWTLATSDSGAVYFPHITFTADDPRFPQSLGQDPEAMDFLVILICKITHSFHNDKQKPHSEGLLLSPTNNGRFRRVACVGFEDRGKLARIGDIHPFFTGTEISTVTIE